MNRVFIVLSFLAVLSAIFVLVGVFWLFFDIVNLYVLIRIGFLLFAISISLSLVIGILGAVFLKNKNVVFKFLVFSGVFVFLLLPVLVSNLDYTNFVMILGLIIIGYFVYDSVSDIVVGPFIKRLSGSFWLNLVFSRSFLALILSFITFIPVFSFKYLIVLSLGVIAVFILEDINRFIVLSKNREFGGFDLVMFYFSKILSSLRKELDDNISLVNAFKLQIEIFSNAKKEIFSSVESLKRRISENISLIEEYSVKYGMLEDELNSLLANYSTYILEFEYSLSKLKNNIDEVKNVFSSSYESISGAIMKREEINKVFNETYPIMDSLFSKVDAVSEIVSNIVIEENKMATNMDLILNELSALTVISTNVQIETFKTKGSKTMMTVIDEISSINNQIKSYVIEMQKAFSKVKDSFEYLKLSSQGLLKHSDRVKFNVGMVVEKVGDVMNTFNSQVVRLSSLDKNLEVVDEAVNSLYSQVRKFREFLEKLSQSIELVSKVKSMLDEIKLSLNETFVVLEEIQQNVSES